MNTTQQLLSAIFGRASAPENRLIPDMTFADYQRLPGVNASLLKNPTAYEMLACLTGMAQLDGLDRMLAEMSGDRAQEIMERVERCQPRKVPVKLVSLDRETMEGVGKPSSPKLSPAQVEVIEALSKGPKDSRDFNASTLMSLDKKGFLMWQDTEKEEVEMTPAMKESKVYNFTVGTVTHAAILEPHLFDADKWQEHWVLSPTKQLTTGMALECLNENPGKTLVTPEIIDIARRCRDAVWKVNLAQQLLREGQSEVTAQVWDSEGEFWRKVRIDRLPSDPSLGICDIKTTRVPLSDYSLRSEIYRMGYALQCAYYQDTLRMVEKDEGGNPVERKEFHIIWVSKSAPFMARCTEINTAPVGENFIEIGREMFYGRLAVFVDAYLRNSWEAYEHEGRYTLRAKSFTP
jgi:hypothetical protein